MKNSLPIFAPNGLAAILLFLFVPGLCEAQTLRGQVRAADNGELIIGATVNVFRTKSDAAPISLASNPSGEFLFENLKPGNYRCEIIAQGFERLYLTELAVSSGKEQVLEIDLQRSNSELPEVTIAASLPGNRPIQPLSEIPLTREQTLRFPAMFFDPGRLAAAYPGVSQTDDGTNSMSIRGNSPAMVRWRIEGLDIVNPNHLPNAGTFSDAPAGASGGVLMFSAQMLDNSSLLTGAFPAGYGDAVAGVMDMNLRSGNTRKHEFTAQAGLVGLDLAAEGPTKNNKDGAYLFNYRYSTVGLLGQLGVSFGDEQISFQDLSFNINHNGKKNGKYTIFGMAGFSKNQFRHKEDPDQVKYDKERFDIDFSSITGLMGSTGKWKLSSRSWIKAALIFSSQTNDWKKANPAFNSTVSSDYRMEKRIATSAEYHYNYKWHQLSAGVQASRISFDGDIRSDGNVPLPFDSSNSNPYNNSFDYSNIQPWMRWDARSPNGRWKSQLGLQFHYNTAYNQIEPAPRAAITYRIAQKHQITASAGLYKQDAPVWLQYVTLFTGTEYRLPYLSSFQSGIRYTWTPSIFWKFSAELFHQITKNIPANTSINSSLINNPEYITSSLVLGKSKARNQGIELGLERSLQGGWFMAANASFFDATYQINEGDWLDSRWDIGHMSNVTFGKEWQREKTANYTRIIGVGIRGVWAGGLREADVDLSRSVSYKNTIYDETRGYYRQYPDYFRADLRVYWKRNFGDKRNSIFSLDIQNVSGQQNLAYHYYDPFTNNIENKYQLGVIPNVSWRLEF